MALWRMRRSTENAANVHEVGLVGERSAHTRGHPGKQLEPTREHLASAEHQLLSNNHGPLDLLGAIEHGLTYEQLLPDSVEISFDVQSIRVLSLAMYVALKEESTLAKDRARLPVLRETLEMQPDDLGAADPSNG